VWKREVGGRFSSVKIEEIAINGIDHDHQMHLDQDITVRVRVSFGEMRQDELLVQLVVGAGEDDLNSMPEVVNLTATGNERNGAIYKGSYTIKQKGKHVYGVRVFPVTTGLSTPIDTQLVVWG
jgi:phosphorylase/glycogen(starch) synthase